MIFKLQDVFTREDFLLDGYGLRSNIFSCQYSKELNYEQ